jgi:hypothetical protein
VATVAGIVLGVGLILGGAGVFYGSRTDKGPPDLFDASASRIGNTGWRVVGVVSILLGLIELMLTFGNPE